MGSFTLWTTLATELLKPGVHPVTLPPIDFHFPNRLARALDTKCFGHPATLTFMHHSKAHSVTSSSGSFQKCEQQIALYIRLLRSICSCDELSR